MKKLNKEELLGWLKIKLSTELSKLPWDREDKQAYQQIKELIQKPKVTEEWIEEKARELGAYYPNETFGEALSRCRKFILSLIEEILRVA